METKKEIMGSLRESINELSSKLTPRNATEVLSTIHKSIEIAKLNVFIDIRDQLSQLAHTLQKGGIGVAGKSGEDSNHITSPPADEPQNEAVSADAGDNGCCENCYYYNSSDIRKSHMCLKCENMHLWEKNDL